jgi:hypothetical protein
MAVNDQPTNRNYLSPVGYRFTLKRAPNVEFFVQRLSLPGLTLPVVDRPTPFVRIPEPGDHLDFNQLSVTFKVNEDLDNYLEVFNWMVAMGKPEKFEQYTFDPKKSYNNTKETLKSDITINILTSAMNGNFEVTCRDCFPISLSELEFDSTVTDINYIEATVTFAIRDYTFTRS